MFLILQYRVGTNTSDAQYITSKHENATPEYLQIFSQLSKQKEKSNDKYPLPVDPVHFNLDASAIAWESSNLLALQFAIHARKHVKGIVVWYSEEFFVS